jgi:amino acid adenylation domain-containing protein
VLRADLSGDASFAELLARVRICVTGALENQHMPFERLIELINPRRDLSRNALFSVNFIFQRSFVANADYGEFRLIDQPSFSAGAFYDLTFFMVERPEGWRISCEYNTDLFDRWTIEGMLSSWESLLRTAPEQPGCRMSRLPLLREEDRRNLIEDRNRTETHYPRESTFVELFESQACRRSAAVAVICGPESLTYAELDRRSNQLARELRRWSLAPGGRVGLLLERSPELLVALLAVMKAGSAYVPLDPGFPHDRIAYVVQDAALSGLITHSRLHRLVDDASIPAIQLDSHAAAIASRSGEALAKACSPEDLVYVIYTSGSTGVPKGVQINHRSLVNLLLAMSREPGLTDRDTWVAVTTLSFDIAALELFLPLLVGAKLVIAKESEAADGQALLQLLQERQATVLQATPARWQVLIDAGWNGNPKLKMLCGGDMLAPRLASELLKRGGELWNLYGPTETTIWSSALRLESCEGQVPIGPPIANTQFYVLDQHQELLPAGVVGELFIGGDGVAAGYWGQPDLTAQRFLPDKFRGAEGAKIYRTGDLVRWRADGKLEFLGRADRQIKLRGYRIEPGEIEAVLCRHPEVAGAAAIAVEQPSGEFALQAYIVPRQGSLCTPAALIGTAQSLMERFLPQYMLPNRIQLVESLPQTPSGKIDRQSLPSLSSRETEQVLPSRPLTGIEQRLVRIWASVLGTADIAPSADFFELGGNSVLAARLLSRMATEFGRAIGLAALFKNPTIEGIARLLQREQRDVDFRPIVKLHANGTKPAITAINNTGIFYELSKELGADQPFTALQTFDLPRNVSLPASSFEEIAAGYAHLIRRVQPEGPYILLGWCIGGALAFEAAQQLQREGQRVSDLILIDCWIPGYLRRMPRARAAFAESFYRAKTLAWHTRAMASGRLSFSDFLAKRRLFQRVMRPLASDRRDAKLGADPNGAELSPQNYEEQLHIYLTTAAQSYDPKPYSGKVLLLRSQQQPTGLLLDESLGWSSYVGGKIEVVCIPGDHFTIFRHPGVRRMARQIRESLGNIADAGSVR